MRASAVPADIATVDFGSAGDIRPRQMLHGTGLVATRSEAERLLKAGAVEIDGVKQTGIVFHAEPRTYTVRVGKKWMRVTVPA